MFKNIALHNIVIRVVRVEKNKKPDALKFLKPEARRQLLGLLGKWKDEGELDKKIGFAFSEEGVQHLLALALSRKTISFAEYMNAQPQVELEPFKESGLPTAEPRSPSEHAAIFHEGSGECYPGLRRTKSGFTSSKGYFFIRIRTADIEADNAMIDRFSDLCPDIGISLKQEGMFSYYELSALMVPREKLDKAKGELDMLARFLLGEKEVGQGLLDRSSVEFALMLGNPDWKDR